MVHTQSGGTVPRDPPPACCHIVPPHILRSLAEKGAERIRNCAWSTLTDSEQARGQRRVLMQILSVGAVPAGTRRRTVFDAGHAYELPGRLVRGEGSRRSRDRAVNEAYDGSGTTWDYFNEVHGRNSIDGRGLRLDSTVHYGTDYDNAFWNGSQMVYGDGDGEIFGSFTRALDVIAHELTHGITQSEANLHYRGEAGALNESFSDVFGSLVKQWKLKQAACDADWLIGGDLFRPEVKARALRSMKEPGTAYDDPILGRDPQPAHMRDFVHTAEDNGGVHINSGIPNRAFCEAALRIGGNAWEKSGAIWYLALTERLGAGASFRDAMNATVRAASDLFGRNSLEQKAVREGWAEVGI